MRLFVSALFGFCPAALLGHHGLGDYDTSTSITIDGKVTAVELKDPHSYLYVSDSDGTQWRIEGGRAAGIVQAGLTKEYLLSGPDVVVVAYRSKDLRCRPVCAAAGRDFKFDR